MLLEYNATVAMLFGGSADNNPRESDLIVIDLSDFQTVRLAALRTDGSEMPSQYGLSPAGGITDDGLIFIFSGCAEISRLSITDACVKEHADVVFVADVRVRAVTKHEPVNTTPRCF